MMRFRTIPLVFSAALTATACAPDAPSSSDGAPTTHAAMAQAPLLVDAHWLQPRLGEEELVILHVGTDSSFQAGHIPGARPLTLQSFAPEVDGLGTEMPEAEAFRALLEGAGVSSSSRIVIYSASHPPQFAARLYLTLDYFGLGGQASILDGGLLAWEGDGRPLNHGEATGDPTGESPGLGTGQPDGKRGSLPPLMPQGSFLVDADFVSARLGDGEARIVDARDPPFWTGAQQLQSRARRPGRIPGAGNVPFRSLVDEDGHFLPTDSLRALFQEAGIQEGEALVAYCHVGQQASLLTVAARLLGHSVTLYDGSWEEWSAREALPAEMEEK